MKKTIIIPLVSLGIIAACTSAVLFASNGFNRINATDGKQQYKIELTSENATGSVTFDDDNWWYCFQLTGTTPRDKKPFNSHANYSYFADYTDTNYTYGGDHILELTNAYDQYGNSFIYLFFPITGPAEVTKAKAFYYLNAATEYSEADLSYTIIGEEYGYLFTYSIPGHSTIKLDKIVFEYNC